MAWRYIRCAFLSGRQKRQLFECVFARVFPLPAWLARGDAGMAGMVLLGVPILGGLVGGTVLQVAMHSAAMSLYERIAVELALISFGAIVIYIFPPGSAREGENWCKFMLFGTMACSGSFATRNRQSA